MGEKQNQPFQLPFDSSLEVDFQGSRVTSDGGQSDVTQRCLEPCWAGLRRHNLQRDRRRADRIRFR